MGEFDLLRFIVPSLGFDKRLENILREAHKALAWHKLMYLDEPCQAWVVYLLAIMAARPQTELLDFCERFEVSEKHRNMLYREKAAADKIIRGLDRSQHLPPSEIYWLLQDRSHEGLLSLITLARRKSAKRAVSLYVTHLRHVINDVGGKDLKDLGYTPGPLYRTILNHLLEAKLDGFVRGRDEEIEFVKRNYPLNSD